MPRERIAALHDARRVEHARECTLACVELAELNALAEREFVALLGGVFEHSPWVAQRAWRGRPFSSVDHLHQTMTAAVREASREEQLALVRAHPELAGSEAKEGTLTVDSSTEQARLGLTRLTREQFVEMAELNRRYRDRFGFPCIVALRLHPSRESVMAQMARRLGAEGVDELQAALGEIEHIARGRLDRILGRS